MRIVSDRVRFRSRTNGTNGVGRTHEIELDDLADAAMRDRLKWAFPGSGPAAAGRNPSVAHRARGRLGRGAWGRRGASAALSNRRGRLKWQIAMTPRPALRHEDLAEQEPAIGGGVEQLNCRFATPCDIWCSPAGRWSEDSAPVRHQVAARALRRITGS